MAKKTQVMQMVLSLGAVAFALAAAAETTVLGPVSLSLPPGWSCETQELNYICLDHSAQAEKNAALVVTFKRRTAEDNMGVYRDQLSRPRPLYQGDVATPSQPQGTRDMKIHGRDWLEGIHLGSEVPNYYTHYYASVGEPYAILISLSIDKNVYAQLLPKFKPVIESLRVTGMGAAASAVAATDGSQVEGAIPKVGVIDVFGYPVRRMYLYIGVALLAVCGLLGYALLSD